MDCYKGNKLLLLTPYLKNLCYEIISLKWLQYFKQYVLISVKKIEVIIFYTPFKYCIKNKFINLCCTKYYLTIQCFSFPVYPSGIKIKHVVAIETIY